LTGTPILNRPIEIFTALNLIDPVTFPSFWRFAQRYCGARYNGFGWDFSGATNTKELHEILTATLMIRRLKTDVLKELPEKTRSVVPLEINRKAYNAIYKELMEALTFAGGEVIALTEIEKAKQAVVRAKMDAVKGWIDDYLAVNDRLVVFATHHITIDTLKAAYEGRCVVVDGRTSQTERQKAVDAFQADDGPSLFIGNIKAAGVGITLTAANATAFVEMGWTPGEHVQAEDRVHRIGQAADNVTAYYLIAADTIEEDIAQQIDRKAQVLSAVLDGDVMAEDSLLTELMNKIREERR